MARVSTARVEVAGTLTVNNWLRDAVVRLLDVGVTNAHQEARWLIQYVLREDAVAVYTERTRRLSAAAQATLDGLLRRRIAGEPLQYVLGETEFYGLEIEVGPGVLIPRPETECLVEFAVQAYAGSGDVCDLCTGSGAVALALARELPEGAVIVAVDRSPDALRYAYRNQTRLGISNVRFLEGDLFSPIGPGRTFALVTANPPYVSPEAYRRLPPEVKEYEPAGALLAGEDGLELVRRIAAESRCHLSARGWVLCEISSEQGERACSIFRRHGYGPVAVRQDYTGRDRVITARWPGRHDTEGGTGPGGRVS